jgi:hypothetical protein
MSGKKKIFLGSFWLLLIFAICQVAGPTVYDAYKWSSTFHDGSLLRRFSLLRILMWPPILLSEAFVYWLIRRRNRYPALSWAHGGIFVGAFLMNIFFVALRVLHRTGEEFHRGINDSASLYAQVYFFWALVIVAHIAFFAVLANCARKEEPASELAGTDNLLDDIEL